MRILGIDPGYGRLGIAVIDAEKGKKETLVYSECFETSPKLPLEERLAAVGAKIADIIGDFRPGLTAIERLYMAKNKTTGIGVAEARGVIIAAVASAGVRLSEYGPGEIKMAVTGHGASDKEQVHKMVSLILGLKPGSKIMGKKDDEWDAVAVALTASAREKW